MDNNTQSAIDPVDRDLAIRTMLGEEPTPQGQAGVASVILNRAKSGQYGGTSPGQVVLAQGQFEPWARNPQGLLSISPDDPRYKQAAAIFDGVSSGAIPDLTGGATHFYAPKSQAALGRDAPAWANGQGQSIGQSLFYAPDGKVSYQAPTAPQGAKAMPKKTAQLADPFSDYQTGAGQKTTPAPAIAAPQPSAGAAGQADPFSEYTTAQPAAAKTAAPSAASAPVAAAPIGANDIVRAAATGVPIIGGALNKMDAATNAALAPLLNPLFEKQDQLQGATWGERYKNALAQQEQMDTSFAAQHPVANTAANIGGAVAGTLPMVAAAPAYFGAAEAPWYVNSAIGAGSNAALSAADAAVRSGGDLNAAAKSGLIGGVLGAAGPAVGALVGKGVNAIANTVSGTSPEARYLANALANEGLTPEMAEAKLQAMGPNATIADLGPSLSDLAGSLAAKGGEPTAILKSAFGQRAAGADDRIGTVVSQYLGQRPDLTAAQTAIKSQASADASPFYNAAKTTAGTMDTTPILEDIESKLPNAVGGVKNVLETAKGYLTKGTETAVDENGNAITRAIGKDDPQAILHVRQALDDFIQKAPQTGDTTFGEHAVRAAQDVRGQIDSLLKSDPNIAAGDAAYSKQMRNLDALQEGTELFKPSTRIEDVSRSLAGKTPDQVQAMQTGALSSIHDAMDNARQGEFAAARSLFAKSSANRAKLDALFPDAGKVFDTVENEIAMRATGQNITGGSQTASRAAIAKEFNLPTPNTQSNVGAAIAGSVLGGAPGAMAADVGTHILNSTKNALAEARLSKYTSGVAKRLAATGDLQDQFMREIGRAYGMNGPTNAIAGAGNVGTNLAIRAPVDYARNALWSGQIVPQLPQSIFQSNQ